MDRMQFVDQITALDLQIAKLREQMTPIRKSDIESDRVEHDQLRRQVQQLAEQKAELRIAFANS